MNIHKAFISHILVFHTLYSSKAIYQSSRAELDPHDDDDGSTISEGSLSAVCDLRSPTKDLFSHTSRALRVVFIQNINQFGSLCIISSVNQVLTVGSRVSSRVRKVS